MRFRLTFDTKIDDLAWHSPVRILTKFRMILQIRKSATAKRMNRPILSATELYDVAH